MIRLLTILIASTIATASLAQQQSNANLSVEAVRLMDSNRDGRITRSEFDRASGDTQLFERIDENGDGVLDAREIRLNVRVRARIAN